jgi:hypothetical protein
MHENNNRYQEHETKMPIMKEEWAECGLRIVFMCHVRSESCVYQQLRGKLYTDCIGQLPDEQFDENAHP